MGRLAFQSGFAITSVRSRCGRNTANRAGCLVKVDSSIGETQLETTLDARDDLPPMSSIEQVNSGPEKSQEKPQIVG